MLTKKTALKTAKKFIEECRKIQIPIDKAIVFGSVIKGNQNEYSDIDVALFSSKFSDNILKNLDLIGKVNIRFPEIDAHTYPLSHFGKNEILLEQIMQTGIEIV